MFPAAGISNNPHITQPFGVGDSGTSTNDSQVAKSQINITKPNSEYEKLKIFERRIGKTDVHNSDSAYSLLGIGYFKEQALKHVISRFVGPELIRSFISAQYDYLQEHSTLLRQGGFFPADPKYKETTLSHQMPFFIKFMQGNLKIDDLIKFMFAHDNNKIGIITDEMYQELVDLLTEKNYKDYPSLIAKVMDPRTVLDNFRPLVVRDVQHS